MDIGFPIILHTTGLCVLICSIKLSKITNNGKFQNHKFIQGDLFA